MDQTNNSDELIEIKADDIVEREDLDIRIEDTHVHKSESKSEEVIAQEAEDQPDKAKNVEESERESEAEADEALTERAEPIEEQTPEEDDYSEDIREFEIEEDDFKEELEEMEHEAEDLQILEEIGDSIVQQVDTEIENSIITLPEDIDSVASLIPGTQMSTENVSYAEDDEEKKSFWARIPVWAYIVSSVAILLIIFFIWLFATPSGKRFMIKLGSKYAAGKVEYQPVEPVEGADIEDEIDEILPEDYRPGEEPEKLPEEFAVITPEAEITPEPEETIEEPVPESKNVYNILLIGEENIDSGDSRGRSDLIMIASINNDTKAVKLTSVMRDCLVAIPGHADNKINAAYAMGGVSLLYETLKANLGVEIDNYMLVNFESFEAIIDTLGGVDVVLSRQEANYLNNTNYISKPEYRTVTEGMNHLNGNQALGYCRIRKVGTADNQYSDFGRTKRQRDVLNEIYKSASGLSYMGLLSAANKCLPYIRTDMDAEDIEAYVNMILTIGMEKGIENFRIPIAGSFSEAILREMIVTKINLEMNTEALRTFIYGQDSTVGQ